MGFAVKIFPGELEENITVRVERELAAPSRMWCVCSNMSQKLLKKVHEICAGP